MLALLADEERVVDPAGVSVGEAHERAFAAIEAPTRFAPVPASPSLTYSKE
ncbi:hypothetical protein ACFV4P_13920 [Kitasatospora sp. NPDC059795]|uniref:hypothetical protein n=1 Tax=Kitasatospora sp. NPDC059795 TaxID=3346949 RepID=UPI0036481D17